MVSVSDGFVPLTTKLGKRPNMLWMEQVVGVEDTTAGEGALSWSVFGAQPPPQLVWTQQPMAKMETTLVK